MTTDEALAYLRSIGEQVVPVTNERLRRGGWTFYSPTTQQALDDADVIEWARNARDFRA